jgi:hypothetical protein
MAGNFNVWSRKHINCPPDGLRVKYMSWEKYPIRANEVTVVPYIESYGI